MESFEPTNQLNHFNMIYTNNQDFLNFEEISSSSSQHSFNGALDGTHESSVIDISNGINGQDQLKMASTFLNDYNFQCLDGQSSQSSTATLNSLNCVEDNRTETRRLKNRESAARSRQKIKNTLMDLAKSTKRLQCKREALLNERFCSMKEVDYLQSVLFNCSIKQINDANNLEQHVDLLDSMVKYFPEGMDLQKLKGELMDVISTNTTS